MSSSHHLALPYLAAAQASKHITHNEALKALDAVVQVGVISRGLATAPASPAEGDRYLVPSGGADAFAGHDGELAAFADGAWSFHTPKAGWIIWVEDESGLIVFDGTAWVSTIPPLVSELGVGTSPDATNRFAVASDAVLINAATADVRVKLNKATQADTATLLFQSGWAGQAEIGLAGNNDLAFKVEAGGTWSTALSADVTNGNIAIGHASPSCALHVDGPARVGQYTVATLPSASTVGAGAMVYVSDKSGGPALAVSNGTDWRFALLVS